MKRLKAWFRARRMYGIASETRLGCLRRVSRAAVIK